MDDRADHPNRQVHREKFTEGGLQLQGLHPSLTGSKVPEVLTGKIARHIFRQADIHQTKADAPHLTGVTEGYGQERGYPRGEVFSSQQHLHGPTLNRYARGDIPEYDADYDYDEEPGTSDVPYHPETYEHGGREWIAEGHHRIVANRLGRGY